MSRRKAGTCGVCGREAVVPIVYGLPGPGLLDESERGEIELGGGVVFEGAPERRCRACGATWSPRGGWAPDGRRGAGPGDPEDAD